MTTITEINLTTAVVGPYSRERIAALAGRRKFAHMRAPIGGSGAPLWKSP